VAKAATVPCSAVLQANIWTKVGLYQVITAMFPPLKARIGDLPGPKMKREVFLIDFGRGLMLRFKVCTTRTISWLRRSRITLYSHVVNCHP